MRESAIICDVGIFCEKLGYHKQIARHRAKFRCSNLNGCGDIHVTIYYIEANYNIGLLPEVNFVHLCLV